MHVSHGMAIDGTYMHAYMQSLAPAATDRRRRRRRRGAWAASACRRAPPTLPRPRDGDAAVRAWLELPHWALAGALAPSRTRGAKRGGGGDLRDLHRGREHESEPSRAGGRADATATVWSSEGGVGCRQPPVAMLPAHMPRRRRRRLPRASPSQPPWETDEWASLCCNGRSAVQRHGPGPVTRPAPLLAKPKRPVAA